jgi:AraC-like DNA-binding protein
MIPLAQVAEIRRLFFAEHWRVGTIATQLGLHPDTVRRALATERFVRPAIMRPSQLDPYRPFLQETLQRYPRLRATRLFEMLRQRGYPGSVVQLRRVVRTLRPVPAAEAYLRLTLLVGEQGQADWGSFGTVTIGHATRRLSAFVLVLSWSRALHAVFTLDQTLESFLRGHVEAFQAFQGVPRVVLYEYVPGHIFVVLCPPAFCGRTAGRPHRIRSDPSGRSHNAPLSYRMTSSRFGAERRLSHVGTVLRSSADRRSDPCVLDRPGHRAVRRLAHGPWLCRPQSRAPRTTPDAVRGIRPGTGRYQPR